MSMLSRQQRREWAKKLVKAQKLVSAMMPRSLSEFDDHMSPENVAFIKSLVKSGFIVKCTSIGRYASAVSPNEGANR